MDSTDDRRVVEETDGDVDYTEFSVQVDGKPTGLLVKAESEFLARRQLVIGATRLGFTPQEVDLIERTQIG